MRVVTLAAEDDFDGWRDAARALAATGEPAEGIVWQVGGDFGDLLAQGSPAPPPPAAGAAFSVPRGFVDLARTAILHRSRERWSLLYALLLRLRATPALIADRADPLVRRLEGLAKEVRRDVHKMRAFVRFREVGEDGEPRYVAWFEPEHHVMRANAAFFVDRFAAMRWTILTPELTLDWDGAALREGPGATRADAPDGDPLEETWRTYYAAIFNPARLKVGAMLKEMPKKYWHNLPETALVPGLVAGARAREMAMVEAGGGDVEAAPARARAADGSIGANAAGAWAALREEAMGCKRCPLWQPATQTVFGEGPADAALMFVGEQPGDQEDLAGHPFVGPAGQMFNQALAEAGIAREGTYVTNAVKHFKYEQRGRRRIHAKPGAGEIDACRWWVEQERDIVRPRVTVALGATAARSVLGRVVTIGAARGQAHSIDGGEAWVTVHPSFLLRLPDEDAKQREFARFVDDLKVVRERAAALAG